ncbi:MAG TPA: hypothetical protein VIA18_15395, partial [Polyangia bacterium]|nr:hypothetical protein [Polyangia bacterium]
MRKIFGGSANPKDGATDDLAADVPTIALPEPQLAALIADLAGFDAGAAGTSERALRYVLTGEDAAVLDLLASKPELGARLRLKVIDRHHSGTRHAVVLKTPVADPLFYVRLGKVYEAAARQQPRELTLTWSGGLPAWLEILVWEASTRARNTLDGAEEVLLSHAQLEAIATAANEPPDRVLRMTLESPESR